MTKSSNPPCGPMPCADRFPGCHAVCDRYLEWHARHLNEKEANIRAAQKNDLFTVYEARNAVRAMKRRNGR